MDIEQYPQEHLVTRLLNLSLCSCPTDRWTRQSNTLIAAEMPYEINPNHIDQYHKLFLNRLEVLGKRIQFSKVHRIEQVEEKLGIVNIIGIFKRIEAKRLRAFEKNFEEYYEGNKYIYDENDTLELEDSTGKLKFRLAAGAKLNGKPISPTDIPYGVVVGLTGKNNDEKMEFVVQNITLPTRPPQKPALLAEYKQQRNTLIMCSPELEELKRTLKIICNKRNLQVYRQIKSIIILGFDKKLTSNEYRELDSILGKYCQSIDIHIMPDQMLGKLYPQRPLHPILFPTSHSKISLVNNPQLFNVNVSCSGVDAGEFSGQILISSGQNIKDMKKNCSYGGSSLDIMQSLIEYSHLCPTSPFSMKCEMMEEDLLIIKQLPHVFIAGGCEKTISRDYVLEGAKVRLVSIKKGQNIVLNIDSLNLSKFQVAVASAI